MIELKFARSQCPTCRNNYFITKIKNQKENAVTLGAKIVPVVQIPAPLKSFGSTPHQPHCGSSRQSEHLSLAEHCLGHESGLLEMILPHRPETHLRGSSFGDVQPKVSDQ